MNIKEAHQNLLNVISLGRIEMPVGALTGQEHVALQQSLQLLYTKALDAEECWECRKPIREEPIKEEPKKDKEKQ